MAIRSGRFSVTDTTTEFPIIRGRSGAFYRVFNSGKHTFSVKPRGSGSETSLPPTFSLDVSTSNLVTVTKASGDAAEGIYDYLDVSLPVRSGRFNIESPMDPSAPHKIIDFAGGSDNAWYRIFNSGKNVIILLDGSTEITRVKEGQSFDFEVGNSARIINVKSEGAALMIDGIYEFLGREH